MNYDLYGPKHERRHFGGSTPKAPPPPPPPPQQSDAEIQAERAKAAKVARGRKGRGASILTGEAATNFLQPDEGQQRGSQTLGR
jgi:hypothetical protein